MTLVAYKETTGVRNAARKPPVRRPAHFKYTGSVIRCGGYWTLRDGTDAAGVTGRCGTVRTLRGLLDAAGVTGRCGTVRTLRWVIASVNVRGFAVLGTGQIAYGQVRSEMRA